MSALVLTTPQLSPVAVQEQAVERHEVFFEVGDLTGADELKELRSAILDEALPLSVRRATLDRYSELLTSNSVSVEAEELAEQLRAFVLPMDDGKFRVSYDDPAMLRVSGTPAQRDWVHGYLDRARRRSASDDQVKMNIRVFSMARTPASARILDGALASRSGRSLSKEEATALSVRLMAAKDTELVQAPRVIAELGSPVEISVMDEIPYVSGFVVKLFQGMEVADPVIDTIHDGLRIRVRAVGASDTGSIRARVEFESTAVRQPIPQLPQVIRPDWAEVSVQVPEVKEMQASAIFEVEEGGSIVLRTVDPGFKGDAPRDVLLLLEAGPVSDD